MQISQHFHLREFTKSQTASRNGIYNMPNDQQLESIKTLVTEFLQPLREYVNKPIIISSGFRSPDLNKLIGGAPTSQHSLGEAVDFDILGMSTLWTCQQVLESGLPFDQMIMEMYVPGSLTEGWCHLSYRAGRLRRQVLTMKPRAFRRPQDPTYMEGLIA